MQYEVVCGKMAGKYLEDSQRFWAVGDVKHESIYGLWKTTGCVFSAAAVASSSHQQTYITTVSPAQWRRSALTCFVGSTGSCPTHPLLCSSDAFLVLLLERRSFKRFLLCQGAVMRSVNQSERIRVTKVTNVTARPLLQC